MSDVFIAKINPQGSALVYSTYLGGSENDRGFAIAVDSSGSAYVTGITDGQFPVTSNALQPVSGGDVDAFVAKLNPLGNALVYSTYLGGRNYDGAVAIAVDSSGQAYVTGVTQGGFPVVNALQPTWGGGIDAFVTKINSTGTALVYSTYLGGSGNDQGDGIAVDSNGNVFLTGLTDGHFPLVNASQPAFHGITNAFVAMINSQGSILLYSTYLGGSGQDWGQALALDSAGNVYVTGTTTSPDFPTLKPIQSRGSGVDTFVAVFVPVMFPVMSLSRTTLNFGVNGSIVTSPQTIEVDFAAGAALSWTASSDQPNIVVSPSSGNGRGSFQVSVMGGSSGVVTVAAAASNSPQHVQVNVATGSFILPGLFKSQALSVRRK